MLGWCVYCWFVDGGAGGGAGEEDVREGVGNGLVLCRRARGGGTLTDGRAIVPTSEETTCSSTLRLDRLTGFGKELCYVGLRAG